MELARHINSLLESQQAEGGLPIVDDNHRAHHASWSGGVTVSVPNEEEDVVPELRSGLLIVSDNPRSHQRRKPRPCRSTSSSTMLSNSSSAPVLDVHQIMMAGGQRTSNSRWAANGSLSGARMQNLGLGGARISNRVLKSGRRQQQFGRASSGNGQGTQNASWDLPPASASSIASTARTQQSDSKKDRLRDFGLLSATANMDADTTGMGLQRSSSGLRWSMPKHTSDSVLNYSSRYRDST